MTAAVESSARHRGPAPVRHGARRAQAGHYTVYRAARLCECRRALDHPPPRLLRAPRSHLAHARAGELGIEILLPAARAAPAPMDEARRAARPGGLLPLPHARGARVSAQLAAHARHLLVEPRRALRPIIRHVEVGRCEEVKILGAPRGLLPRLVPGEEVVHRPRGRRRALVETVERRRVTERRAAEEHKEHVDEQALPRGRRESGTRM